MLREEIAHEYTPQALADRLTERPDITLWLEALMLKAVARDPKQRFTTAEEFVLAIERGAARPLQPPTSSALMIRDRLIGWQIAPGVSAFVNFLLVMLALTLGR